LYGRGSVDAKGPLCTFAAAASLTAVPDEWRITVVGAVEEEAASSKGARHVLAQRQAEPPVYCIIGEPSQWDRITLGYKGRLLVHVNLLVPFSHSAGQDSSPAECGVNLWHAIQRYANTVNESREGAFNKLDAGLRAIRSDDEGAFGRVSLTIGFRLPPDISPQALEAAMRELIETYAAAWQVELQIEGHETAYRAPKSNQLVRAFLKAIRATAGQPRFVVKTGTSDMNIVAPIWQCPILAYGPGDSSLDHTPQEHLDLVEYQQAIMVLHRVLVELINPT
jgi:LysW-gamma-L-lysine carboxypeptidase